MCGVKTPLPVVSLFIFQVNHLCSSMFLSHFNCFFFFFPSQRTRKDNNKAPRAAANGEAVFVNGGIHLETLSVNCATQNAAQSRSDHHASHQTLDAHTQECTQKLLDRWCSEEERNHISAERGWEERRRAEEPSRRTQKTDLFFIICAMRGATQQQRGL